MAEATISEDAAGAMGLREERKQISQSYWSLVWWKFKKNKLAVFGAILIVTFYIVCVIFPEFFAPYTRGRESGIIEGPPSGIHFFDGAGNFRFPPVTYGYEEKIDPKLRVRTFEIDSSKRFPIGFFVRGEEYKLLGLIPMSIHFIGVANGAADEAEANFFFLGTDRLGRDQLSRIIYGGRISLIIGLVGVTATLIFGTTLGAISGYYGGWVDMMVQRTTEFLTAFPREPLFLALGAAIPVTWPSTRTFFVISLLLAFITWGGLARQVRSLILSLRESQYVLAAQSFGASDKRLIFQHLIPGTMSHVIVIATLAIPGMILLETALTFLGLGLQPPVVSWGLMLQDGGTVRAIRFAPHLLWPVPVIISAVLGFNMLGDGLRDALDPYSGR
jgi:peptide/nickel transport system permease protein